MQQLRPVANNGKKVDASPSIIAFALFKVSQNRKGLPPKLPIGDLVVLPASNNLEPIALVRGDAEARGPKDEADANRLDGK